MTDANNLPAILYFGNDWTAENRTSSHHIANWLAKRCRVYYIECPGLRAPKSNGRDLRKALAKLVNFLGRPRQAGERLKVTTLMQIPLHRFAPIRMLNALLLRWSLRWLIWREGIKNPITWFMVPHMAAVMHRLGERLAIYYCIDDYAALPDVNPTAIRSLDAESTRKADIVFVASATLVEQKRQLNPNTVVSPHGVDLEHFKQAQGPPAAIPADIQDLPRPIVGFFGLIERWIDLQLVGWLAEQRPLWTFVMIGRVAVPKAALPQQRNLHFLGKKSYGDLPSYGRQFQVALIPYKLTQQVFHANPIKLREYLAMGKPVVSVSTPEIEKYSDIVEIAHSKEEYLAKLDKVLAQPPSPADAHKRLMRVATETWDDRLCEVLEVISQHLTPLSHGTGLHAMATSTG